MSRKYKQGSYCAICGDWKGPRVITAHHIHKRAVWGDNGDIVPLCPECHMRVEAEVTKRENTILRENFKSINLSGYNYIKEKIQNERKRSRKTIGIDERKCKDYSRNYNKNGEISCL